MTVEYVDAGEAIDQGRLSGKVAGGEVAPPVVRDVNYERVGSCPNWSDTRRTDG
jgi:alcohol dehydrogenase (cytochrome c)